MNDAAAPADKTGFHPLRAVYRWMLGVASGRHAEPALAAVAFTESAFFPIPPDVMLAPMALAKPERAYRYAVICTIASVLGGILGYAIGLWLAPLGMQILKLFGYTEGLDAFRKVYDEFGLWVILVKGFTPIPYKLVTIASGLAKFNFAVFVAASVVTRGGRFFLTAWLLKRFGPVLQAQIERRIGVVTLVGIGLVVLGFLLVKLI